MSQRLRTALVVLGAVLAGLSVSEATGVTHLVAMVLRFSTPEGTLLVEVDGPSVQVTIEGDGGLIIRGAGAQKVRLRPGSYRIPADKLEERIAPGCRFNPNAGPWTPAGYAGGRFKYGKYVGNC